MTQRKSGGRTTVYLRFVSIINLDYLSGIFFKLDVAKP